MQWIGGHEKKQKKEKRLIVRLIFNLTDFDQFSLQNLASKTEIGKAVIFFNLGSND